ncbi:hypothetical protein O3M35_009560 [Rhynocoris fuscipes]|uniref:Uncharacterized protein n=1 Tax=Rhynocoris fuscipes TaxID=488301 RepID=A0AAW1D631_9HEMI
MESQEDQALELKYKSKPIIEFWKFVPESKTSGGNIFAEEHIKDDKEEEGYENKGNKKEEIQEEDIRTCIKEDQEGEESKNEERKEDYEIPKNVA